jgi:hypothetical protein
MKQGFWGSPGTGGGAGTITSVNGQVGPAVVLTLDDVMSYAQADCLDNATEVIGIGSATANELYEIMYAVELNVSGKKRLGKISLGYDSSIIFDDESYFQGVDISGLDIQPSFSGGNLRLEVTLLAVGENSKFRYSVRKINQIV